MAFVEIDSISCIDELGNEYIVIVRQKIFSKLFGGVMQKAKGHIDFTLDDGRHINMIGNDFKIFELVDDSKTRIRAI